MLESMTFALAAVGYVGLTASAVAMAHGRAPMRFFRIVVVTIALHVALVWHVRYGWSVAQATRNGYVGFALFHAAFAAIAIAAIAGGGMARALSLMSFGLVTLGALGAVFRDEVAATWRVPVVLSACLGVVGLAVARWRRPI